MREPINLHSEHVLSWTQVLHRELQLELLNEINKLSCMLAREKHVIHIKDEEDG